MPSIISGRTRTKIIEHLSSAFVSLLKAQEELGYDNTLDDALLATQVQLQHHLGEV